MKYAFIEGHRPVIFDPCDVPLSMRIHPSGFYAWLKESLLAKGLSKTNGRPNVDQRGLGRKRRRFTVIVNYMMTCAIKARPAVQIVWRVSPDWHGIKAQIGYKRRPGKYGGKPSIVVDNTLNRQFDVDAPD